MSCTGLVDLGNIVADAALLAPNKLASIEEDIQELLFSSTLIMRLMRFCLALDMVFSQR